MTSSDHSKYFEQYMLLADAIHLSKMAFAERIQSKDPGTSIEDVAVSPAELVDSFIGLHYQQIDALLRTIGNLESRLAAVQDAAGIRDIEYPVIPAASPDEQ